MCRFFISVPLQILPRSIINRDYMVFNVTQALLDNLLNTFPWVEVSNAQMQQTQTQSAHFRNSSTSNAFGGLLLDKALIVVYENIDASQLRGNYRRKKRHLGSNMREVLSHINAPWNVSVTMQTPSTIDDEQTECGIHTWYVDFRALQWYWILYPSGYYANSCRGRCTVPKTGDGSSNYAVLKSLYHTQTGAQQNDSLPVTSCTPTQMTSITLIYCNVNTDMIAIRLPQMVIRHCGCR